MKTVATIFLLVGVLAVGSEVQAQPIYGCVNAKGALRIVSGEGQCKPGKESLITWNQAGQPGPKGDIGAKGLEGPAGYTGPSAVDGTGQNIGILVSLSGPSNFVIFNQALGAFFTFGIDVYKQQVSIPHSDLFTESEDCTGQKYFDQEKANDPLFSQSVYLAEDGLYYAQSGPVQTIKMASILSRRSYFEISPVCVRLCGFYPYRCSTNNNNVSICTYDKELTIYGQRIEDGCPPSDASIGPESNPQWLTQDREVVPMQVVTIPFTTPITLPLAFR